LKERKKIFILGVGHLSVSEYGNPFSYSMKGGQHRKGKNVWIAVEGEDMKKQTDRLKNVRMGGDPVRRLNAMIA
jgi:hypothetical protein